MSPSAPDRRIRTRVRIRAASERGQTLVLTTLSMLMVMGFLSLGVDTAIWYQKHHQAQVAADAAALAAANCMANVGVTSATFTDQCTTTTDAANVATTLAGANGISIPTSDVNFSNETVTVTTPNPTPSVIAELFGIGTSTQTAKATATWNAPITSGCDPSQEQSGACYFAFAKDNDCPDVGMTLQNNGNVRITGGVWSNSGLDTTGADNNSAWGNVTYGNGSGCAWTASSKHPSFTSGPTRESPITSWPRDYTTVLKCGTGQPYQCTGPNNTPSYCTQAAPAFGGLLGNVTTIPTGATAATMGSNQVYCAYGTSTNMSDPTTWNGAIDMTSGTGSTSDSFIGGVVDVSTQGSVTLTSQLSTSVGNLLVFANDALSTAASVQTGGTASISGDVFAPNGTVTASSSGGGAYTSFLEGWKVLINASGNMTGDGPQTGTSGSSSLPGADSLSQ